jgi:hypothetical protein
MEGRATPTDSYGEGVMKGHFAELANDVLPDHRSAGTIQTSFLGFFEFIGFPFWGGSSCMRVLFCVWVHQIYTFHYFLFFIFFCF